MLPVELGCRASAIARLLWEAGVIGKAHRKAIKALANVAEGSNHTLWLKRKNPVCAAK